MDRGLGLQPSGEHRLCRHRRHTGEAELLREGRGLSRGAPSSGPRSAATPKRRQVSQAPAPVRASPLEPAGHVTSATSWRPCAAQAAMAVQLLEPQGAPGQRPRAHGGRSARWPREPQGLPPGATGSGLGSEPEPERVSLFPGGDSVAWAGQTRYFLKMTGFPGSGHFRLATSQPSPSSPGLDRQAQILPCEVQLPCAEACLPLVSHADPGWQGGGRALFLPNCLARVLGLSPVHGYLQLSGST